MVTETGGRSLALDRSNLAVGLPWLLVALLLALPLGAPVPVPGLDPSWQLALNTTADAQFGRDIVYTYGPWGFLDVPLITSRGAYGLALLFRACVLAALWVVSVRGMATRWPLWVASPVASVFVVVVASADLNILVFAVAAQYALLSALGQVHREQPRARLLGTAGLAGLAGLMIQVKFPTGMAVGALAALVLLSNVGLGSRLRQLTDWGLAVGSFLGVACASWLARGQSLANVGAWVRGSRELTTGYPEAMGLEFPDPFWRGYVVAAILALLGLIVMAAALRPLREQRLRRGISALLVLAASGGFAFKSGFTRHDVFHEVAFFVIVGAIFLALVGTSRAGSWVAALGAAIAVAMAFSTLPAPPGPVTAAGRWRADVSALASRDHQVEALAAARAVMIASHQVPDAILDRLDDRPVSIDSYETSAAWAYRLNWRTVPVFQLYAAYTPALDQLNATALRQAPAEQLVLRHELAGVDGRHPLWDSPLYHRALACSYRTVVAEASWTLLAKAQPRCGQPEPLGPDHVAAGQPVEVPAGGETDMVIARFTPDPPSVLVRLGRALVKPFSRLDVIADGAGFRISRKTSPSGMIVAFPAVEAGAYAPIAIGNLVFTEPGTLEFVRIPITQ